MSIFAWRLFHEWLPVDSRLQSKGIQLVSKCVCCNEGAIESLEHLFIHCEGGKKVATYFATLCDFNIPDTSNLRTWWQSWRIGVGMRSVRRLLPMVITWFIWRERNRAKHDNIRFSSIRIIVRVKYYITLLHRCKLLAPHNWKDDAKLAFHLGLKTKHTVSLISKMVRWRPPSQGWMKLNSDGASRGNPGEAGAGGLVRNEKGEIIFAFYAYIGVATNNVAELYGVCKGLELCFDKDIRKVWVELDAQVIIHLITRKAPGQWEMQHALQRIRGLMQKMEVTFTHIFREGNTPADLLANKAIEEKSTNIMTVAEVPSLVKRCAKMDNNFPCFRFRWG